MAFDIGNNFIRPGSFQQDRANGLNAEAVRFDEEANEVAAALTLLKQQLAALSSATPFNPALYTTTTQLNALLAQKQPNIGYTPVDEATRGQPSGFAPLNSSGQIDAQYLPTVGSTTATWVNSFQGRQGNVALLPTDISSALGFAPANVSHTHTIAEVAGLQTALNAKQDNIGFTPANASHVHTIGEVTGLQALLDQALRVSSSSTAAETTFELGTVVLVNDATVSPPNLRAIKAIRVDTATQTYNWTVGTLLVGQWRCCGKLSPRDDGGFIIYNQGAVLMQRVS